ncbi:MAG: FAD-dependent oxidoreductase [Ignavibacterium sp.]
MHNNCKVNLSEKCVSLEINNNRINKVITTSANSSKQNVYDKFDFVISAVPFFALKKLLDKNYLSIQSEFNYSSILNIHLWLTQEATKKFSFINKEFYAFNNSELHWLFNKQTHWNIVISNADKFMDMPKEKIFSFVLDELKNFIPIRKDDISEYKIIKEKRATFIPDKKTLKNRPAADTKIENLFLAGDWIDTKLPATIESAVKSGRWAAEKIIFNHN